MVVLVQGPQYFEGPLLAPATVLSAMLQAQLKFTVTKHQPHVHETTEQAVSRDMEWLGLWGKDVTGIPLMSARYAAPFARASTPGEGVRMLFRTAWAEDREVRQVRTASLSRRPDILALASGITSCKAFYAGVEAILRLTRTTVWGSVIHGEFHTPDGGGFGGSAGSRHGNPTPNPFLFGLPTTSSETSGHICENPRRYLG